MARPAGQSDAEKETPPGQGGVSRKGQLRKLSKKAK
jgi:hypothetical protein